MMRYITGLLTAVMITAALSGVAGLHVSGTDWKFRGNGHEVTATVPSGLGEQGIIADLAYTSLGKEKGKFSKKARSMFNGVMEHLGNHSH